MAKEGLMEFHRRPLQICLSLCPLSESPGIKKDLSHVS